MSKRIQTKDLYQRMGRPEFTPQAKASTFAYVAPQSNKDVNTLLQFAGAGQMLAGAASKWGKVMMAEEESEGLKEGKRLALISYRKKGMKAFRAAEINGDIENADNPFVKKFYLHTMGQIAANSEAFQNHLMLGAQDEIQQKVFDDKTAEEFDIWAQDNILARVDSFMEDFPDSRWMRDSGFGEAAVAVVEKAKQTYRSIYKNKISTANIDGLTETLDQGLDRGEFQDTYDHFNGVWKGSEDDHFPEFGNLKSIEGVAPRNTLPVEVNQRLFWFRRAEGNVNGLIVPKTSLSHAQSIRDAMDRLTILENLENKSDGTIARFGTSRVLYDDLRNRLKQQLVTAEITEVSRRKAAEASAESFASDIFLLTAPTSGPTVTRDQRGVPTGTDLELPKQVGDPGQFSADWWKKWRRGELINPITGKTLWFLPRDEKTITVGGKKIDNPAFGDSMSPTRAEMEIMEDRFVMQAVVDEIAAVRTSIEGEHAEFDRIREQGKNATEAALITFKQALVDMHRGSTVDKIGEDGKRILGKKVPWSDRTVYDKVKAQFGNPVFGLADEVLKWNLTGVRVQALSDVRDALEKNFPDSRHIEPRQKFFEGLEFIDRNMSRLSKATDANRQAELLLWGATPADAKYLSELVTRQAKPFQEFFSFRQGKDGNILMSGTMNEILTDVPDLENSMFKDSQGKGRSGTHRFSGPLFRVLHNELQMHMREEYLPLVRRLGTLFNMNTENPDFTVALEKALWQKGNGPVIIPHPTQTTPAGAPVMVQLLPYSIRHSFITKGEQPNYYIDPATGQPLRAPTFPTALMTPLTAFPAGHRIQYTDPAGATKFIKGAFGSWTEKLEARKHKQ